MSVTNPRFPHWCRIVRRTSSSPLVDERPFSTDYDPMGSDADEGVAEEAKVNTILIYEGECRSYEKNTTSDRADVISSQRGLSLPFNEDDWSQWGMVPQEGDEVKVDRGSFMEYGMVVDKNPATASFAGTHLTWRYIRS